ncbi:hypothetical protein B5807_00940 [Epicoccum nigrum]|uniref:F-box domain-containing protein n=1 Tax=Epicoccum nigrum TaxID=105696 RepID=A0A1Y2MD14_EPING|nr:hypothetical protein B5807_00940 [Epicoccum nigrum]
MAPATSSKRRACLKLSHFGNSTKTYKRTKKETAADTGESATELESTLIKRNREQSPLLRLPGEIRNHIYEHALGGHHVRSTDGHIRPSTERLRYIKNPPEIFIRSANLERVCKQLRRETRLLPYALNSPHFFSPEQFTK